jgi:hypothetical protein
MSAVIIVARIHARRAGQRVSLGPVRKGNRSGQTAGDRITQDGSQPKPDPDVTLSVHDLSSAGIGWCLRVLRQRNRTGSGNQA